MVRTSRCFMLLEVDFYLASFFYLGVSIAQWLQAWALELHMTGFKFWPSLSSCVTPCKLLNITKPQFYTIK